MAVVYLDIFIIALLVTTICYCIKLSRRITLLHQGKDDLNKFIQDFNEAIMRAENNINELKVLGSDADENLRSHIESAQYLANDLSFLMEKGENVADMLEQQIAVSRTAQRPTPAANYSSTSRIAPAPLPKRTSVAAQPKTVPPAEASKVDEKKAKEIEQLLRKKAATSPSQTMTPSKKKALDEALGQIAKQKQSGKKVQFTEKMPASRPEKSKSSSNIDSTMEKIFNKDRVAGAVHRAE